jgi:hypothetical protein
LPGRAKSAANRPNRREPGGFGNVRISLMAGTEYLLWRAVEACSLTEVGKSTKGNFVMNDARTATDIGLVQAATTELKGRIRRIRLEDSLVELACGLCMEEVPVEKAFQQIQDKAMEKMVPLLDTKILDDSEAIRSCLELVAQESERVAWKALQKGTEMLEEGLAILEEDRLALPEGGYVN